jgi:hypothetical protein
MLSLIPRFHTQIFNKISFTLSIPLKEKEIGSKTEGDFKGKLYLITHNENLQPNFTKSGYSDSMQQIFDSCVINRSLQVKLSVEISLKSLPFLFLSFFLASMHVR